MNKTELQNNELHQVSGGADDGTIEMDHCPDCGYRTPKNLQYPEGFLESVDKKCSGSTYNYRCPKCNHDWRRYH